MDETFRISGIEVRLTPTGEVWFQDRLLGRVGREERFGQWFWRAYDAETGEAVKRFLTSRPEAIQLLLLRSDLIDGIGF
ncbi:hypothetical protein [Fimbriimonas ginsengisoli]|uniref:Uncharacterized protein n=1 Tax=Fimbriimonas ginsengisoli Gsoil 348 TaxID=661478 RepID=A0A068NNV8_FIMGI|nr:hypothetical protein [Fimbriimonas ginsengisoli]AIE85116.1 hypothetical protein OP10G_1748 [Fimbriimonas ginsengisoli Gsoil 348]